MYETKSVTATATDGTTVDLVVPAKLPLDERADYLRELYSKHVKHSDHWKGPCHAKVATELADDVAEAMDFMGSVVDTRVERAGMTLLRSDGYWAHGF